jgi:Recombination endonuclease VII
MGICLHGSSGLKRILWRRQGKRCAICRERLKLKAAKLDHDHVKGGFRGVLCGGCNTGLGFFCDSPELLRNAAVYVRIRRIARFPRLRMTRSEAGKRNVKFAAKVAWSLPRTKRQLRTIRRARTIRLSRLRRQ